MKSGAGRKPSPLDDIRPARWASAFTTELLALLWVLEATVATYPEQESLLKAVVEGDCFQADDLPPVPDDMRRPPRARAVARDLFDLTDQVMLRSLEELALRCLPQGVIPAKGLPPA